MCKAHVENASDSRLVIDQTARSTVGHVDGEIRQRHAFHFLQLWLFAQRWLRGELHAQQFSFLFVPAAQNVLLNLARFSLALFVVLLDVIAVTHFVRPIGFDAKGTNGSAKQTGN